MGKKDTPDYKGAAEQTAASDERMLDKQTAANRPNQYNPWGSMEWTQDEGGNWSQTQTLTDDAQSALDAQMGLQKGKSEQALGMMDRMKDEFGQPVDWGQYGEQTGLEYDPSQLRQRAEDASYNRATSRLDPRFEQEQNALEIKLANQGLSVGDRAYDDAMANQGRTKEDAYSNAQNQAVQQGKGESAQDYQQQKGSADYANQLRQNSMKEMMQQRGMSLNEINAIMSGQQVQTPGFEGFNQAGKGKGADYSGAMKSGSDYDQANKQMLYSGIGDIAGMFG
jgi:hypothetical protein